MPGRGRQPAPAAAPGGAGPSGTGPTAPTGAAPTGAAPTGAAPTGAAPIGSQSSAPVQGGAGPSGMGSQSIAGSRRPSMADEDQTDPQGGPAAKRPRTSGQPSATSRPPVTRQRNQSKTSAGSRASRARQVAMPPQAWVLETVPGYATLPFVPVDDAEQYRHGDFSGHQTDPNDIFMPQPIDGDDELAPETLQLLDEIRNNDYAFYNSMFSDAQQQQQQPPQQDEDIYGRTPPPAGQ